jgi:hypothetical protein
MLECALIYSSFMFLLVATFDVGQYMFMHQTLVERARNAVRYGCARAFDATAIRNMVLYNSATVPGGASPIFNLTSSNVSVAQTAGSPSWVTVEISGWSFFRFTPLQSGQTTGQKISVMLPSELP